MFHSDARAAKIRKYLKKFIKGYSSLLIYKLPKLTPLDDNAIHSDSRITETRHENRSKP